MRLNAAPQLAADAVLRQKRDRLVVETPHVELEFAQHGTLLKTVLGAVDGVRRLEELASLFDVDPSIVCHLLQPLVEEGAVFDAALALDADDDTSFVDALFQECRLLARGIYARPFWRTILAGAAPLPLIYGWGIEFAYFVEAANEYMPAGIAHCRESVSIREAFARHYVEEANHSTIFYEGLAACGLDVERLRRAPPLPTTRALINQLNELAIEGSVPYAAAFAVMQPAQEAGNQDKVRQFYDKLRSLYPGAAGLFDAMQRHALIDIDLGHEKTVFEVLVHEGGVPAIARRRAIEAARTVAECFVAFFEGISDAYGDPAVSIPRRCVRLVFEA